MEPTTLALVLPVTELKGYGYFESYVVANDHEK